MFFECIVQIVYTGAFNVRIKSYVDIDRFEASIWIHLFLLSIENYN